MNETTLLRLECAKLAAKALNCEQLHLTIDFAKLLYDWSLNGKVPSNEDVERFKNKLIKDAISD
jgi:hypothetical protein